MLRIAFTSLVIIASSGGAAVAQGGWTYYQCQVEQRSLSSFDDTEMVSNSSVVVRHNAEEISNFADTPWGGGWLNWCQSERDNCYVSREFLFRQRAPNPSPDVQFEIEDRLLNRITGEYNERVYEGHRNSRGEQRISVIIRHSTCVQLDGSPFDFE